MKPFSESGFTPHSKAILGAFATVMLPRFAWGPRGVGFRLRSSLCDIWILGSTYSKGISAQRSLHAWLLDHDDKAHAEDILATKRSCAMYLWYSLLWALIEGMEKYKIPWIGMMGDDVEYLSDRLRRCRNAVFHVPRDGQWDKRLFEIMFDGPVGDANSGPDEESVYRVGRLTSGIGRLFLEEYGRRESVRPE